MVKTTIPFGLLLASLTVSGCSGSQAKPAGSPADGEHATRPLSADEDQAVADARKDVGPSGLTIDDEILRLCPDVKPPYFDFNSASVKGQFRAALVGIADCMKSGGLKDKDVLLVGHADPRGEEDYNLSLGGKRADSIRAALAKLGAPNGKLDVTSRGALDAKGDDEESWSKDRRVDIRLKKL
jgi:peptidoglycan-associated lipoprotein